MARFRKFNGKIWGKYSEKEYISESVTVIVLDPAKIMQMLVAVMELTSTVHALKTEDPCPELAFVQKSQRNDSLHQIG